MNRLLRPAEGNEGMDEWEGESDLAVLLRTIDFAARVCGDGVQELNKHRNTNFSVGRIWTRHLSKSRSDWLQGQLS